MQGEPRACCHHPPYGLLYGFIIDCPISSFNKWLIDLHKLKEGAIERLNNLAIKI